MIVDLTWRDALHLPCPDSGMGRDASLICILAAARDSGRATDKLLQLSSSNDF
jgi:hypothetical protein